MSTTNAVLATFGSKSKPGHVHEVRRAQDGSGNVYCTCPSWKFQKNSPSNRTCKHIEQWKRETLAVVTNPRTGVSETKTLAEVVGPGPGPEAIRAPRKSRKAAPKVAPVVTIPVALASRDGYAVEVNVVRSA
jgi:hypothetical protein